MKSESILSLICATLMFCFAQGQSQVSVVWTSSYNGPASGADNVSAMTIDASGNVYVAGEARTGTSTTDSIDYALVKYNPSGDTLWVRFYNGTGNKRDVVRAIAVDNGGNVYVTGESYGTTANDIATVKYNSAGVQQWAARYNGPADGPDGASAIVVDESGMVYITGYSDGDASPVFRQDDYVTIKYNASGTPQWIRRYDGPSGFHDIPHAIAVDASGNVYVTGESSGIGGTRYNYCTIKYDSQGDSLWIRQYNGPANYDDRGMDVKVDSFGNVYVTGSSDGTSSDDEDYATIAYDASGTEQWIARYQGPGGGDEAFAMEIDDNGNLYVTGRSRGPGPTYSYDYLTIRYSAATGDTLWTARYNGDGDGLDAAVSIALDGRGNVFVTGYSLGISSGLDCATLGYDSIGTRRWIHRYSSSGSSSDLGIGVSADTSGFVYVAGTGYGGTQLNNFVTIKYHDTGPVGVAGHDRPTGFLLSHNYPNPFNASTTVGYSLDGPSRVLLKVFNILGQEVALLVDEHREAGMHFVLFDGTNLPSGFYFYRLQTGSSIDSKKMVLLK